MTSLISTQAIQGKVHLLRNQRVMFDFDLAALYGVPTKALNQAVKRNLSRFSEDFMFQITEEEMAELNRSQLVTGSQKHREISSLPYAFTEQGIAMLSSVLRSGLAVQVNIAIMRMFVQMRAAMLSQQEMAKRLDEMEQRYDDQFHMVFDAIRELVTPPNPPKKPIGFLEERREFAHG